MAYPFTLAVLIAAAFYGAEHDFSIAAGVLTTAAVLYFMFGDG